MTHERKAEIDAATVEKPVMLNRLEVAELRMRNRVAFYNDVKSKRFLLEETNTIRNLVTGANETGFSNAEIAAELDIPESSVRRILEGPLPKDYYDNALEEQTGVFVQVGTGERTT